MSRKNGSPSKAPEEKQLMKSPQRIEVPTTGLTHVGIHEPPPSPNQGNSSSIGPQGGAEGIPPVNMQASPVVGGAGDAAAGVVGPDMGATSRKRVRKARDQLPFQGTWFKKGFLLRAFPPPVLSREEFAHRGLLNPGGGEQLVEQAAQEATLVVAGEVAIETQVAVDPNESQLEAPNRVQYRTPDLNRSPPPNWNSNGNGDSNDEH